MLGFYGLSLDMQIIKVTNIQEVLDAQHTAHVEKLLRSFQHENMIVINLSQENSNSVIVYYR